MSEKLNNRIEEIKIYSKRITSVFLFLLLFLYCTSQKDTSRSVFISLTPTVGVFKTNLFKVNPANSVPIDESFIGLNYGFKLSIIKCLKSVNAGFGLSLRSVTYGLTYRRLEFYKYNTFRPAIFGVLEFDKKNNNVSFELNSGALKATVNDNYNLFISAGPVFKIGNQQKKITVNINPSLLFQVREKTDKIWPVYGSQTGILYEGIYRTLIFDLGIVIQFNKFENPTNLNE